MLSRFIVPSVLVVAIAASACSSSSPPESNDAAPSKEAESDVASDSCGFDAVEVSGAVSLTLGTEAGGYLECPSDTSDTTGISIAGSLTLTPTRSGRLAIRMPVSEKQECSFSRADTVTGPLNDARIAEAERNDEWRIWDPPLSLTSTPEKLDPVAVSSSGECVVKFVWFPS